jgi:hypothetical protein
MSSFFKEKPIKPPSISQIELCGRLGLEITPKMGYEHVSSMLRKSLKEEKHKNIYDAIQEEHNEQFEKINREEYGDKIVDELKKWETYCDVNKQYYLIFKRGGELVFDIAEIASAAIFGEKTVGEKTVGEKTVGTAMFCVQLGIRLPKARNERHAGDYVEWEKQITLKPEQILRIEALEEPIDMFDLSAYVTAKNKCKSMAEKYIT